VFHAAKGTAAVELSRVADFGPSIAKARAASFSIGRERLAPGRGMACRSRANRFMAITLPSEKLLASKADQSVKVFFN
jgi:hypothetical protein